MDEDETVDETQENEEPETDEKEADVKEADIPVDNDLEAAESDTSLEATDLDTNKGMKISVLCASHALSRA